MTDVKKQWEQREGEPNEAYARFLVYRNLGVGRTLDAAYSVSNSVGIKRNKSERSGGQWHDDSAAWDWKDRSAAWDIEVLAEVGRGVVAKFVGAIDLSFGVIIQQLASGNIKPKSWSAVLGAITTLGAFIPQETVSEIRRLAKDVDNVPAIGHDATDKPVDNVS
jgi:hypothetical protein